MNTEKLNEEIEKFIAFVENLEPKYLEFSKESQWHAREVLIHLVFWQEEYVKILENKLEGAPYQPLEGTFKEHNRLAVEENRAVPVKTLINRWRKAQTRFAELLKGDLPKDLTIHFKEEGKDWPVAEISERIAGHVHTHLMRLKRKFPVK